MTPAKDPSVASTSLRYARDALRSARDHMQRGLYDVAAFEARQAALAALHLCGAGGHTVFEAAADAVRRCGLSPAVLACASVIDRAASTALDTCEDACPDEMPEVDAGVSESDATSAVSCAESLLGAVEAALGLKGRPRTIPLLKNL